MRWDFIIEHWTALLLADSALVSVMGSATGWIYAAQSSREVTIPSIEYLLIYDNERELWNAIGVQVDIFAKGTKKTAQIERRIRTLTHRDTSVELGGEKIWMRFVDGRTLDYPAEPGVVHRALDFHFEAAREKYAAL